MTRQIVTPESETLVVTLTVGQLRSLVSEAVAVALEAREPGPTPALLNGPELQRALGVSAPTLRRLRREGMPVIRIGDAIRFERERVVAWLRAREQLERAAEAAE